MLDRWFEAHSKGRIGSLLIQRQKDGKASISFKTNKHKPQRIDGYVPSADLLSGNGTECSCVLSIHSGNQFYCLTRLHRFCGLSTNDYGQIGELKFRVSLLRVHLARVLPSTDHMCLPRISMEYPPSSLQYGSVIKLGGGAQRQRAPPKRLWVLNIVREAGYEAYAVHTRDGPIGMALIPNVETGNMLSSGFGGPQSHNLDDIEESDDEDAPWQHDGSALAFACRYCTTFRKWVPVKRSTGAVCSQSEVEEYIRSC